MAKFCHIWSHCTFNNVSLPFHVRQQKKTGKEINLYLVPSFLAKKWQPTEMLQLFFASTFSKARFKFLVPALRHKSRLGSLLEPTQLCPIKADL